MIGSDAASGIRARLPTVTSVPFTFARRVSEPRGSTIETQDALAYYARALDVCEQVGDAALQACDVAHKRELVHARLRDVRGSMANFGRMLIFARRLGDPHREELALAYRGWASGSPSTSRQQKGPC